MIRVIQVGIGGMGNRWLETVLASPEVEFAGFVEVNESVSGDQAARHGLDATKIFKSLPEALAALAADGVDGIIDVTPPQYHRSISETAMNAGKPVLSEKPLSNTLEDAKAIVARANETGVLHMVAQNYRYTEQAQTLKYVLESGELGAVGSIHIDFFKGAHFAGFRSQMAYPLIIDMAIHHFDMLRFFANSEPVSIFGRSWNPPWSWNAGDSAAVVSLQLANGVQVVYNGSWVAQGSGTTWNAHWRFDCTNGVLRLENDQVSKYTPIPDAFDASAAPGTIVTPIVPPLSQQAYLLHEFHDAVVYGKKPTTVCQDNIRSLALIFDIIRSFETGSAITPTEV